MLQSAIKLISEYILTVKLYNTETKTKTDFIPRDPDHVTMYVCGPTVYSYAHIGNARPAVVFDVVARVLRTQSNVCEKYYRY